MGRRRKRLTAAERAERDRRRREFMWVFRNGKQVRVRRPQLIEGMTTEEFVARNADPLWLHQHELWELMSVESGGPVDPQLDGVGE